MAVYFLDSSGVVKRYVTETGTAWVRRVCNPTTGNDIYTAHVTGAEAAAAIMRRVRQGGISTGDATAAIAGLQAHLRSGYTPVSVTDGLVQRAIDLECVFQIASVRGGFSRKTPRLYKPRSAFGGVE